MATSLNLGPARFAAQSMADMIATLEERGLIERHRDQADRRRLAIALLPAGQELLDRYRDQIVALEARMLRGITKPQITAMRRKLTICHANLTADRLPQPVPPGTAERPPRRPVLCSVSGARPLSTRQAAVRW